MLKLYNKAIDDSLKLAEEQHKGKGITHAPRPYNEENGFVFFKFKMKATGVNKNKKKSFLKDPSCLTQRKTLYLYQL